MKTSAKIGGAFLLTCVGCSLAIPEMVKDGTVLNDWSTPATWLAALSFLGAFLGAVTGVQALFSKADKPLDAKQTERAVGRALSQESVATRADLDALAERILADREPGTAAPPLEQLKGALDELASSHVAAKAEALALIENDRLEDGLAKLRAFAEQQSGLVGQAARQTADTWRQLGFLSMTTDASQAAHAFEEAERVSPGNFETLVALCRLYCFAFKRMQAASDLIPRLRAAASDERSLSLVLEMEGDIHDELGDLLLAADRYRESLEITRKAAAQNPHSMDHARDLAVDLRKFSLALGKNGDSEQALSYSLESLDITRAILAQNPLREQSIRDVTLSLERVGDALLVDAPGDALRYFQESLVLRRQLVDLSPGSKEYLRDLSVGLEKVALAHGGLKQYAEALAHCRESLPIAEALAAGEPDHAGFASDLLMTRETILELEEIVSLRSALEPTGRSLPSDPG